MSFLADPIGNISGALHKVDKSPLGKALEGAALMAVAPELMGTMGGYFGGGAALGSALTVGGIAGLSSGNLAQGLMAGLSAYGGASLVGPTTPISANPAPVEDAASRMMQVGSQAPVTPGATIVPTNVSQFTVPSGISETELGQAGLDRAYSTLPETPPTNTPMPDVQGNAAQGLRYGPNTTMGTMPVNAPPSGIEQLAKGAGDKTTMWQDVKNWAKNASPLELAGAGAAGLYGLKALTTPQKLNMPKQANTQNYRYYSYSPQTGYTGQGITPVTGATGGIVALANGGGVKHYEDGGPIWIPDSSLDEGGISLYPSQLATYAGGRYASFAPAASVEPTTPAPTPATTGLSDQQIADWFKNNQYASDTTVNNAINQNKVDLNQLSRVTGVGVPEITDRQGIVNDITAFGNTLTPTTVAPTNGVGGISAAIAAADTTLFGNDPKWAAYMDAHKDASGNVDPLTVFEVARATGIPESAVQARYDAAKATTTVDGGTPICAKGYHWDAASKSCVPDVVTAGSSCPIGSHWDAASKSCVPDVVTSTGTTCPIGSHWNDILGKCVPDAVGDGGGGGTDTPVCAKGYHWDAASKSCVPDAVGSVTPTGPVTPTGHICPTGYHWDDASNACVKDIVIGTTVTPNGTVLDTATLPTGQTITLNPTNLTTTNTAKPTDLTTAQTSALASGVGGNTGPSQVGGGATVNPNGTITTSPRIPDIPIGGFTGIQQLSDAYTKGGGSLGYVNAAPKNMADFTTRFDTQSGGSRAAYDYLMGKSPYPTTPYTPTGEIARPYQSSVMGLPMSAKYTVSQPYLYDAKTRTYKPNPDYDPNFNATKDYLNEPQTGISKNTGSLLGYQDLGNGVLGIPNADGTFTGTDGKKYNASGKLIDTSDTSTKLPNGVTATPVSNFPGYSKGTDGKYYDKNGNLVANDDASFSALVNEVPAANGGLMGMAMGGSTAQYNLGSYSDGGRLLRGPGDGVSDSIPATIGSGNPQPARLADGEFVVPARIVSELGNGSTEAGARQLYKMMDRVQSARRKTVGSNKVAANTRAEKYLPV